MLKKIPFSIWIILGVAIAMIFPEPFKEINGLSTKVFIIPLLQIIMVGMGAVMTINDFKSILIQPKAVIIGVICQLTIMPFVGLFVVQFFDFPPEVAAGIILIGSMPGGLASNVMTYLARANIALSVTLTSVSTLLSALVTPFWMKVLANQYIEIDFWKMFWEIIQLIILPIGIGVLYRIIFKDRFKFIDNNLSKLSMWGIAIVLMIISAFGRDSLIEVGLLMIVAGFLHNSLGYLLGYQIARILKLSEPDRRTIAIEVGMQNAGLASGIAIAMNKVATLGVAAVVFGPLMNITGSTLANYWKDKEILEEGRGNN